MIGATMQRAGETILRWVRGGGGLLRFLRLIL